MKTIQRKFTHPSDGLEMSYMVDVYAPKGTLLISTIRGDLGHKQATGENRSYNIELHDALSWKKLIEDGVTTIPAYIQRWPNSDWLGVERLHVKTPRLKENFISTRFLEQDDDSGTPYVIDFWSNDSFFSKYGYSFIESSSSTTLKQRGHPFLVFDKEITDRDYYEEILRSWIFYYQEHADRALSSCNELFYHKKGSKIHIVGNICPLEIFHDEFVIPYRIHIERLRQDRLRKREERKRQPKRHGNKNRYTEVVHANVIEELENAVGGTGDRHTLLLKSGMTLASLAQADWHDVDSSGWQGDIMLACQMNGYVGKYGLSSVERSMTNWDTVAPFEEPN